MFLLDYDKSSFEEFATVFVNADNNFYHAVPIELFNYNSKFCKHNFDTDENNGGLSDTAPRNAPYTGAPFPCEKNKNKYNYDNNG